MGNKLLEEKVDALEKRVADLEKYIALLTPTKEQFTPEEDVINAIVCAVGHHFTETYSNTRHKIVDVKSAAELVVSLIKDFFNKAGLVSLEFENGRAFLYALHPASFTEPKNLWNYLAAVIKQNFDYVLCIGLFDMTDPRGIQISKQVEKSIETYCKGYLGEANGL